MMLITVKIPWEIWSGFCKECARLYFAIKKLRIMAGVPPLPNTLNQVRLKKFKRANLAKLSGNLQYYLFMVNALTRGVFDNAKQFFIFTLWEDKVGSCTFLKVFVLFITKAADASDKHVTSIGSRRAKAINLNRACDPSQVKPPPPSRRLTFGGKNCRWRAHTRGKADLWIFYTGNYSASSETVRTLRSRTRSFYERGFKNPLGVRIKEFFQGW